MNPNETKAELHRHIVEINDEQVLNKTLAYIEAIRNGKDHSEEANRKYRLIETLVALDLDEVGLMEKSIYSLLSKKEQVPTLFEEEPEVAQQAPKSKRVRKQSTLPKKKEEDVSAEEKAKSLRDRLNI